jgi:hypothetical protein
LGRYIPVCVFQYSNSFCAVHANWTGFFC